MKVYIHTDLEGVAGVTSYEDLKSRTYDNFAHRQRMYSLLTNEVNAAVRGAKAAGASVIFVNDSHGTGYNIRFENLEHGCEIIHGRPSTFDTWLPFFDATFDALVCIGAHAMTASVSACMPHTKWEVNGGAVYLSEGSMAAAIAGCYDVPLVFISGDQTVTAEVREKVPQVEIAVVKHAASPYAARSLLPAKACELIEIGVRRGIERRKQIPPYKVPGPPFALNLLDGPNHITVGRIWDADICGDNFLEVFNKALRRLPGGGNTGSQKVDGYRYPDNLLV